jgi:hypothetical protein
MSTEEAHGRASSYGAFSVLNKPIRSRDTLEKLLDAIRDFISQPIKDLVVVGSGPAACKRIAASIGGDQFRLTEAVTGEAAIEILGQKRVDCLVLDAELPDMPTDRFLKRIRRDDALTNLPVILYSDRDDADPVTSLTESVSFRRVSSPERLLDQTAFYLHSPVDKLPEAKRRILEELYQTDRALCGRKVLIVDDDIRNIFALTSILEWRNMVIVSAETGRDAIRLLQTEPDIEIVLMDIMMPEMDGLDTMRVIRKLPQFNALPIIAVTAKAMKGDREKCIEAGAWDYLSKPVDTEQLLSVLRVWLHR